MAKPAVRELVQMARQAGYHVVGAEQLRSNRWLLILTDDMGDQIALLVQARPLINSADVQDLADTVRLRELDSGILLAYGGSFSAAAQRTHQELADSRLRLCTTLPPAARPEPVEPQHVGVPVKSTP
jgi:HPt (histidine-containing phosphotransfer) domain-containing protein